MLAHPVCPPSTLTASRAFPNFHSQHLHLAFILLNHITHSLFLLTASVWEAKLKTDLYHCTADAFFNSSLHQTWQGTSWWQMRCLMEIQKTFLQEFISWPGRKLGCSSFPHVSLHLHQQNFILWLTPQNIRKQNPKPNIYFPFLSPPFTTSLIFRFLSFSQGWDCSLLIIQ